MRIEFLGTGGAVPPPRPGCACRICAQAREKGVPHSRGGPSLFVHGPDLLVDTPEDIRQLLNRSRVGRIGGCLYSHWHPDHTMGLRIWESLNGDWFNWPDRPARTRIFFPRQVAVDIGAKLGTWSHFEYLAKNGLIEIVELMDGERFCLNGVEISPFRLAEEYVYALLLEGEGKRVLVAPDELLGWTPGEDLGRLDLAVLPMGVAEFNPLTGERHIAAEHPVLKSEATFRQTLEVVRRLDAARVVLTHIEEPDQLSHEDLLSVAERLGEEGLDVAFAYDTLVVEV